MKKIWHLSLLVEGLLCTFLMSGVGDARSSDEEVEGWTTVEGGLEGKSVFSIRYPPHWDVTRPGHSMSFVGFLQFWPIANRAARFNVQMGSSPLRPEYADLDALAQTYQQGLLDEQVVQQEALTIEPLTISGLDARRLTYEAPDDTGSLVRYVYTFTIVSGTQFLLEYEAPIAEFARYESAFKTILASFELDREALRKFWEER